MGYQVGNICYATKTEAENAYYSNVVPVITQGGQLMQPIYNGTVWQLAGNTISSGLPECDPLQNMKDGSLIGWGVFSILLSLWSIKLIHQRLRI